MQKQLVESCGVGNFKTASVLIKRKGAKADKPDSKGRVPLREACKYGHVEIVRLLIENKAKVNCFEGSIIKVDKRQA